MVFANVAEISCVFVMFMIWFLTLIPVRQAQNRDTGGMDLANPRSQYERLDDDGRIAKAANDNTFEGLVFFSIAVLFCTSLSGMSSNAAERDAPGAFSIIYVFTRAIYPFLYYKRMAKARSAVWTVGLICIIGIWAVTLARLHNYNRLMDSLSKLSSASVIDAQSAAEDVIKTVFGQQLKVN